MKNKRNPIVHSFPVQLVFNHIKRNVALLAVWVILIAAMSGSVGRVYGIHYLFLDPEYLGRVNFWSFFIVGITFGQLVMAFHMASYILDGHRYAFVGILRRPFSKFALNNSIVPLIIFSIYVVLIIKFQLNNEFKNPWHVISDVIGFISGQVCLLFVSFFYFKFTNKDIFKYLAGNVDRQLRKSGLSRERVMRKLKETRNDPFQVDNYIGLNLSVEYVDKMVSTYDKKAILKVFDQNHINSVLIGLLLIICLVLLGGFIENPILQIPAAASSMLIMTVIIILLGSISYWFRGWGLPFILALFFIVNYAVKNGAVKGMHEAKGLDYSGDFAPYKLDKLREISTPENYNQDIHDVMHSLENWKSHQSEKNPKMVIVCTSGGGQRAALWTLAALQKADSIVDGSLMAKTTLITGASGGMIGAAYFRELYLRSKTDSINLQSREYADKIASDNLNPVIFSLLVNDAFFSFREYEYAGKLYTKDRGYSFERNLNANIDNVLDKKISDYAEPEQQGLIPTMLLSPTISNDGRKLYVTSRPFSFMNVDETANERSRIRGVDFLRFFEDQDAEELSFMTALRMSASFPYITPTISLPSKPRMEIMDAGIADNFGIGDALRFMYVFRNWIDKNTSGVVMVVIRDTQPNEEIYSRATPSVIDRLTYPIGSVYNNLSHIQDRNNDVRLEQAKEWMNGNLETIEIIYDPRSSQTYQQRASLSWHLTKKEKHSIISNIYTEANKKALNELKALTHSE